ncbi:hypothetical protein RO03_05860 [Fusobacterium nucleatum subsp. nucleatum]|uniref:Uncharacterized protein n=1 Tax=Fusobacterium nucleatum subsp. nucleatum TaxID=76856 RepID=A0A0X3Y1Y9_FUSNC|nr:hypothetical protein [Fusobacterium nucleatum]KUL99053.1 hypothetical protein RO03_05860 [Fusobacterium nucleatum subsp. nucleatum]
MEFHNHLIDEKFVRNKEEELYCIKFSSDSGEYSTVEITSSSNLDKKYTFIVVDHKEQFYKDQTLLTLRLPLAIEKAGRTLQFRNNFIKFLKSWYYSNDTFSMTLTNLQSNLEFNFFKEIITINKSNFFFEGIKDKIVIFRILLDHSLLK